MTILRQQAALLGRKTKNIVEGQVETKRVKDIKESSQEKLLEHSFYLVAPALDFYKYPLFRVQHGIMDWYPLKIFIDVLGPIEKPTSKTADLNSRAQAHLRASRKRPTIKSEEELVEKLKEIFALEETQKAIESLIAQSRA